MNRWKRFSAGIGLAILLIFIASVGAVSQSQSADFDRALSAMSLSSHDRILAAIEVGLETPGFPAGELLSLIDRLTTLPASAYDVELVLLLQTRALESGMSIDGLVSVGFDLATALANGLPIEAIILEAFKGIAQRSPVFAIEARIRQRLTLLDGVRDLLFACQILRTPAGGTQSSPNALPAARFDQLVSQIADAVSDYLEGGGSPSKGATLYELVADRLHRLPPTIVRPEDVELVLDRIGPNDLTQIAIAALNP